MTVAVKEINVADVVFRKDLYPRLETSAETVQKYAEDLSVLPPAEVNQHTELIDGWHRWTAHKKRGVEKMLVTVTETESDAQLLEFAIERNATHGLQLSQADKKKMATRIYLAESDRRERMEVKKRLAKILSVSEKLLDAWLSRAEKDMKEAARKDSFDLWLSYRTQDEIAELVGWPKMTVNDWLRGLYEKPEIGEIVQTDESIEEGDETDSPLSLTKEQFAAADHVIDFEIPIYNIWKQQDKSKGSKHFGNSEVRWLDNLLYLYTKRFDGVVDPFAGGGSAIDICRKRLRRYWVSDRKPIIEASAEGVAAHKQIRQWDITQGLPPLRRWGDVRLVYLDPPYWKQAEGQYSDDPTDLANMNLEMFNKTLSGLITGFAKKLHAGSFIALIMQPTQWNAPERQFTDHVADMLRLVRLPVDMRYSVPYESQQCTAQMVEWSKENKRPLVLTREIIVWRIS